MRCCWAGCGRSPYLSFQDSPMGVIPKKNKPGMWRLIVDLLSPEGLSVNDGVDIDRSSLSYASVDHLSALVVSSGRGCFLVKADIKEAYRMVPVHPRINTCWGLNEKAQCTLTKYYHLGSDQHPKYFQQ